MATPNPSGENIVWSGSPSQKANIALFSVCGVFAIVFIVCAALLNSAWGARYVWVALLLPIGIAGWRWLSTRSTVYTLTDQRLKMRRGVFSRVTDDIELYRVKDSHFTQPFMQRVFDTYENLRSDGALPSTWEVIYAQAFAPEPGQPIREHDGEIASVPLSAIPIRRRRS